LEPHSRAPKSAVSPARATAFDILLRVERESSYASELLHAAVYDRLSTADHALATELVMGVLRWRSRLDDEISAASSQPLPKLDLEILTALRLALYQLRWLDRVPPRAALHESVELVKRARKRSAAPFVNAVLRKLSSAPKRHPKLEDNESVSLDASSETLALAFAHPLWMVQRWADQYGLPATRQICKHNQSIPVAAVRLRTPTAERQLKEEGVALVPGGLLSSARRVQSGDITKTHAFRSGQAIIQDEASQLVATLVGNGSHLPSEIPSYILDCCAAPGGKTLAIADHNPGASITALELHPHRARLLQKLLDLRGLHSAMIQTATVQTAPIQVAVADARRLPISRQFDRVLADVPCSGTGTLARNPEIKWRLSRADLSELHLRQVAILRSALTQLAPGGRLIYSTCSLEKEENEDVLEQVLEQDQTSDNSFRLFDCRAELDRLQSVGELTWPDTKSLTRGPYFRTLPGVHPCDGFFAAILERPGS
jgi:16S rRNA (cytosine967-C5)-methyltransferase